MLENNILAEDDKEIDLDINKLAAIEDFDTRIKALQNLCGQIKTLSDDEQEIMRPSLLMAILTLSNKQQQFGFLSVFWRIFSPDHTLTNDPLHIQNFLGADGLMVKNLVQSQLTDHFRHLASQGVDDDAFDALINYLQSSSYEDFFRNMRLIYLNSNNKKKAPLFQKSLSDFEKELFIIWNGMVKNAVNSLPEAVSLRVKTLIRIGNFLAMWENGIKLEQLKKDDPIFDVLLEVKFAFLNKTKAILTSQQENIFKNMKNLYQQFQLAQAKLVPHNSATQELIQQEVLQNEIYVAKQHHFTAYPCLGWDKKLLKLVQETPLSEKLLLTIVQILKDAYQQFCRRNHFSHLTLAERLAEWDKLLNRSLVFGELECHDDYRSEAVLRLCIFEAKLDIKDTEIEKHALYAVLNPIEQQSNIIIIENNQDVLDDEKEIIATENSQEHLSKAIIKAIKFGLLCLTKVELSNSSLISPDLTQIVRLHNKDINKKNEGRHQHAFLNGQQKEMQVDSTVGETLDKQYRLEL